MTGTIRPLAEPMSDPAEPEVTTQASLTISGTIASKQLDRTTGYNLRCRIGIVYQAIRHEAVFYRGGASTIDLKFTEGDLVTVTGRPRYEVRIDEHGVPDLRVLLKAPNIQHLLDRPLRSQPGRRAVPDERQPQADAAQGFTPLPVTGR